MYKLFPNCLFHCLHQLEKSCTNSTPHSWSHKRAHKELLDWYSDKQQVISLKNTLLESSSQKTRSPIFPCPYSRASSSQVQLHLDTRFLGNSNSPLIRTKSDSLGFTSYIYCKFNFENPKPRSQQCFVAPFLCISQAISCFVCPKFNPQMLCAHLFLAALRCPITPVHMTCVFLVWWWPWHVKLRFLIFKTFRSWPSVLPTSQDLVLLFIICINSLLKLLKFKSKNGLLESSCDLNNQIWYLIFIIKTYYCLLINMYLLIHVHNFFL